MNGSRGLLAWCHFQMTDSVLLLRNSQPTLLSKEKVGAHQGFCKSFELLPSSEIHTSASYSVSEIAADGDSETRVCPCGAAPEAAPQHRASLVRIFSALSVRRHDPTRGACAWIWFSWPTGHGLCAGSCVLFGLIL